MELVLTNDFKTVKAAYTDIIENTPEIVEHAHWIYGLHPTDELLRSYIDHGEMYVLKDAEKTAGVVAIVMHQGQDYKTVQWEENLADDEVAVLHLLAVCPAYQRRGTGKVIVEKTIGIAGKHKKKAVRLDTLASNLPAQRLYEKSGFQYRGRQRLFVENTVWLDFVYYEKKLCQIT